MARTAPIPPWVDLGALTGAEGFAVDGIDPFDRSGFSVAGAGDVNGDGVDDILIGAQYADPNGLSYAGEAYIVFGGPTVGASGSINPSTLNGANGFVIEGINAYDFIGRAVSGAGDVNGDGVGDIVIGASNASPTSRPYAGETYVVFGKDTSVAGPFGASIDLASLDGTDGFVINGIDTFDRSGVSVSRAGDVNGDGVGDILIGAPYAAPNLHNTAGESYVVFGKDTSVAGPFAASMELASLDGGNGFVLRGVDAFDYSGNSVASGGDVNGDGVEDVVIGAFRADPNGQVDAGETYVVFGKDTSVDGPFAASIDLSTLNGSNGFVLNGIDPSDASGRSIAPGGDVNGDTVDDLVIGAAGGDPHGQSGAGETYVVFGGGALGASGSVNLSTLNGTNGFVVNGARPNDLSGSSISSAGDLNTDGFDDLIIGVPGADFDCAINAGESFIVLGGATLGASGAVDLAALDETTGWFTTGIEANDALGRSVSGGGDVNGDGVVDVLIGAPFADPGLSLGAGATYVLLGPHPAFGAPPPGCAGDTTGDGCANIADFNVLAGNFGTAVTPNTGGDLTGDGLVNISDFNILAGDFGCGAQ